MVVTTGKLALVLYLIVSLLKCYVILVHDRLCDASLLERRCRRHEVTCVRSHDTIANSILNYHQRRTQMKFATLDTDNSLLLR